MNKASICLVIALCINITSNAQNNTLQYLDNLKPKNIIASLQISTAQSIQTVNSKILEYSSQLLAQHEKEFAETLQTLNSLRNPYYQYRVGIFAKQLEGTNIYHDYAISGDKNDETNTCANGWCQVVSATGIPGLAELASGRIQYFAETIKAEQEKEKPNLFQKKPKYVNVGELLKDAETLGFLPIDLDLTQKGDFCIQYYRKTRIKNEFTAQHISIVDQVILWQDGAFELRDWHEGIEGYPYTYRTGSNLPSSFNNIFSPQNVYYGFQNDQGREKTLATKNPNICQGYAFFGSNVQAAKELIAKLNDIRGQIFFLKNLQTDSTDKSK
jgi:hypothetical protein